MFTFFSRGRKVNLKNKLPSNFGWGDWMIRSLESGFNLK